MDNLSQGCFQLSRSIYDSEIFHKPSDRFKVWIYILGKVNFRDNGLPRGSAYFKYERIERDCKVKYNIVTKICKYLKEKNQIDVKKATHGCVITVVNYSLYQGLDNYKGNTEARQRQDRGDTGVDNINKNERMKEGKKQSIDDFDLTVSEFINMRKTIKKPMTDKAIELLKKELEKIAPGDKDMQIAIMNKSIMNCWQGVFVLKDDEKNNMIDPIIKEYDKQTQICHERGRSDDRENNILIEKRKELEIKYGKDKSLEIRKGVREKYK